MLNARRHPEVLTPDSGCAQRLSATLMNAHCAPQSLATHGLQAPLFKHVGNVGSTGLDRRVRWQARGLHVLTSEAIMYLESVINERKAIGLLGFRLNRRGWQANRLRSLIRRN